MADIEKVDLASENLVDDRLDKLKELMPEVFSESGIDFDKLRLELGDEVDESQERYAFTWPGKADAIRQSQTVSTATLRPCVEKSRGRDGEDGSFDSDNIYIEGDNLEVLKLLQRGYHGKVNMIYIDPPYNTGNDFVYRDSFGDTINNYKKQTGLTNQSNADSSGRYHSNWCSMVYPRLKLARELLSDDGVIFISIDDNELDNLKKLANEVFGEENFVGQWAWFKSATPANLSKKIKKNVEYVLAYEKRKSPIKYKGVQKTSKSNNGLLNQTNRETILSFPANVVMTGLPDGVYHSGKYGTNSYEIDLLKDTHVKAGVFSSEVVLRAKFKWSQANLDKEIAKGTTISIRTDSFSPSYEKAEYEPEVPPNLIDSSVGVDTTENAGKALAQLFDGEKVFDYPKPVSLVSYLFDFSCGPNDVLLDFFSGSATSAEAIIRKNTEDGGNRKFILVQIPEKANGDWNTLCDIGEERIRRTGDKVKTEISMSNAQPKLGEEPKHLPDIGFRVFTLDDSGIKKSESGQLVLDVVKPDRTELDIVFEMMLKWGLELTLPVEKLDAAGYPVWSVACDELICCMSRGLTIEALEAVADMEPRRVLILDSVLDDTLKLNAMQIFKHAGERMGSEIELKTV